MASNFRTYFKTLAALSFFDFLLTSHTADTTSRSQKEHKDFTTEF